MPRAFQPPEDRIIAIRDSHWVRTATHAYLSFLPDSPERKRKEHLWAVRHALQLALVDERLTTTINSARHLVHHPNGTDYALQLPSPRHDNKAGAHALPQCANPLDNHTAAAQLRDIKDERKRRDPDLRDSGRDAEEPGETCSRTVANRQQLPPLRCRG
jgi:hypothetical protein